MTPGSASTTRAWVPQEQLGPRWGYRAGPGANEGRQLPTGSSSDISDPEEGRSTLAHSFLSPCLLAELPSVQT